MSAALKDKFRNLSEANAYAKEIKAGVDIRKRMTTLKGSGDGDAETGDAATGGIDSSPMPPSAEQLAKINKFTRSPKTADQVVAFNTLACNDLYDRDDERFTPATVEGFAVLAGDLSPVGKAYMVSHDYTKLPVGRIFGVGTKDLSVDNHAGDSATKTAKFLTAEVYMPNTDSNKTFIENLDFGINWAVSVGVMLDAAQCSLPWCGAPMYSSRFMAMSWCSEGHDKGLYYTQDAETNSWGEPAPCSPDTPGSAKCRTDLIGAKDFYELSQCFLGAQYFAALEGEKAVSARNLIKAAGVGSVPILGLSRQESHDLLDDSLVDPRVRQAIRQFGAQPDDEGILTWTDDQKLVWQFSESEVTCLGKSSEGDGDGEAATGQSDADSLGESDEEQPQDGEGAPADGNLGEGDQDGGDLGSGSDAQGSGQDGSVDPAAPSADDNDKEATVSKAAVVKALRGLGNVPDAVLRAVEDAEGDGLDVALTPLIGKITTLTSEVYDLTPKAALGDTFIQRKRSEAIDWYVKANQTEGKGVNTDNFQKILDACGDNVDLLDEMISQHKSSAQAKFPDAIRRSTFPTDPHAQGSEGDENGDVSTRSSRTVSRIHG